VRCPLSVPEEKEYQFRKIGSAMEKKNGNILI
jgi:hypothetical protein